MSVEGVTTLLPSLGWDEKRGAAGTWLFIVSEAMVFASLFFAYYYLARAAPSWPMAEPPKLRLSSIMLALLVTSSVVLFIGERWLKQGKKRAARIAGLLTLALGLSFLVVQFFEYKDHLKHLTPMQNAYGSIFYTITSIHAAHLMLAIGMLAYATIIPRIEPRKAPPHKPFHSAALYWHFVDVVWVLIYCLLYVVPNLTHG